MSTVHTTGSLSAAAVQALRATDVNYMTDGGLETTLLFLEGLDLPDFAAFPLLDTDEGRAALTAYFEPYLDVATARSLGIVLDTPTWRASPDWGTRLGYDRAALVGANERAVDFIRRLAQRHPDLDVVLNGIIGPRGDGYVVGEAMTPEEAASYHALQVRALANGGVDTISAVTMTYTDEAIGIARAAAETGVAAVIGFTVETDGRLPTGQALGDAITAVDAATDASPLWYMVNCAHPSHFEDQLVADAPWLERVRAVRANASRMSHEELDQAPELDRGDPDELADDYRRLRSALPALAVVGGCCGTDHEHLDAITAAIVRP